MRCILGFPGSIINWKGDKLSTDLAVVPQSTPSWIQGMINTHIEDSFKRQSPAPTCKLLVEFQTPNFSLASPPPPSRFCNYLESKPVNEHSFSLFLLMFITLHSKYVRLLPHCCINVYFISDLELNFQ